MKIILLLLFISFFHHLAVAQNEKKYSIEIVSSIEGRTEEAIYFYKNNWKVFREKAKELNYLSDYKLLISEKDSSDNVEILLLTEYENQIQFDEKEKNFIIIIDSFNSKGPDLLNNIKPNEFRKRIYSNDLQTID